MKPRVVVSAPRYKHGGTVVPTYDCGFTYDQAGLLYDSDYTYSESQGSSVSPRAYFDKLLVGFEAKQQKTTLLASKKQERLAITPTSAVTAGGAPVYYDSGRKYDSGFNYDRWYNNGNDVVQGESPKVDVVL